MLWLKNNSRRTAMHRLVVNPDTAAAWEIPLNPGLTLLGRADTCDFPISHESVSSSHCEVTVGPAGTTIKDLGSRNGTFVNGELVEEAALRNGQTIRLGDVQLRYESDSPAPAPAPPARVVASAPGAAFCKYHPRSKARFFCPKCRLSFCELCVNLRPDKGRMSHFCRSCASECTTLQVSASEASEPEISFFRAALGAFAYPLKGDGIFLLIAGGTFFLLIDAAKFFAKYAFLVGLAAFLILTVFGTGYLVSYLRRILTSSAIGEDRIPDWPEITSVASDLVSPFFQLVGTVVFCFAPAIALTVASAFIDPGDSNSMGWVVFALILLSSAYFPMAFTAVAMFDSVMAVNPLLIIPSILKIPSAYLLTIVLFAAILLVRWLGFKFLPTIVSPRLLSTIIASYVGLYLMIVEVRILGLLYRMKKAELGWFNR